MHQASVTTRYLCGASQSVQSPAARGRSQGLPLHARVGRHRFDGRYPDRWARPTTSKTSCARRTMTGADSSADEISILAKSPSSQNPSTTAALMPSDIALVLPGRRISRRPSRDWLQSAVRPARAHRRA